MSQNDDLSARAGPGDLEPPPRPRGHHERRLIAAGVVLLAWGAIAAALIGSTNSTAAGETTTATSKAVLSASRIASRMDPALVDVVSTDGDQNATSAGTASLLMRRSRWGGVALRATGWSARRCVPAGVFQSPQPWPRALSGQSAVRRARSSARPPARSAARR